MEFKPPLYWIAFFLSLAVSDVTNALFHLSNLIHIVVSIERRKLHIISNALSSFLRTNSTGGFHYKWVTSEFKLISIDKRKLHLISTALSSFLRTNSTGGFNYKWSITATKLMLWVDLRHFSHQNWLREARPAQGSRPRVRANFRSKTEISAPQIPASTIDRTLAVPSPDRSPP